MSAHASEQTPDLDAAATEIEREAKRGAGRLLDEPDLPAVLRGENLMPLSGYRRMVVDVDSLDGTIRSGTSWLFAERGMIPMDGTDPVERLLLATGIFGSRGSASMRPVIDLCAVVRAPGLDLERALRFDSGQRGSPVGLAIMTSTLRAAGHRIANPALVTREAKEDGGEKEAER